MQPHFYPVVLAVSAALGTCTLSAQAEVTAMTITRADLAGTFAAGGYVRLEGEAIGELGPAEPITDLAKAPRNARGKVAYKTRFTLVTPLEPKRGNGSLIVDLPNRGLPVSHALYNSPRSRPLMMGSLDEGTGFLQSRGFMVVAVQWEPGQGFEPPSFTEVRKGKNSTRYVDGAGMAAVRDVTQYLRHGPAPANPLAGAVKWVYATGYSQSAQFLKSYLTQGFNTWAGGQVFDGVHIVGAAAGQWPPLPVLPPNAGARAAGRALLSPASPVPRSLQESPLTYDQVLSAMSMRGEQLPKLMVTHFQNDYLADGASLVRTGATGTGERPLPARLRMYDIAGAGHLNVRDQGKACKWPYAQLDWSPPLRAQLSALDAWVKNGQAPPLSAVMPLAPLLPLVPLSQSSVGEAAVSASKSLPQAMVRSLELDSDGNALGGIRLPDVAVPLATQGALNAPASNPLCRLVGSFRPFARTAKGRIATGDLRPSLEERYPGGLSQYTNLVRQSADALVAQRHVLPEDAAAIVNDAAENPLFQPSPILGRIR